MGEYAFEYQRSELKERQQAFCFHKQTSKEYPFAYDRDIISNTSWYNNLVPVVKNGTGLSVYDKEFYIKSKKDFMYHTEEKIQPNGPSDLEEFSFVPVDSKAHTKQDVNIFTLWSLDKTIHLNEFKDYNRLFTDNKTVSRYEVLSLSTGSKKLSEYKVLELSIDNKLLSEYQLSQIYTDTKVPYLHQDVIANKSLIKGNTLLQTPVSESDLTAITGEIDILKKGGTANNAIYLEHIDVNKNFPYNASEYNQLANLFLNQKILSQNGVVILKNGSDMQGNVIPQKAIKKNILTGQLFKRRQASKGDSGQAAHFKDYSASISQKEGSWRIHSFVTAVKDKLSSLVDKIYSVVKINNRKLRKNKDFTGSTNSQKINIDRDWIYIKNNYDMSIYQDIYVKTDSKIGNLVSKKLLHVSQIDKIIGHTIRNYFIGSPDKILNTIGGALCDRIPSTQTTIHDLPKTGRVIKKDFFVDAVQVNGYLDNRKEMAINKNIFGLKSTAALVRNKDISSGSKTNEKLNVTFGTLVTKTFLEDIRKIKCGYFLKSEKRTFVTNVDVFASKNYIPLHGIVTLIDKTSHFNGVLIKKICSRNLYTNKESVFESKDRFSVDEAKEDVYGSKISHTQDVFEQNQVVNSKISISMLNQYQNEVLKNYNVNGKLIDEGVMGKKSREMFDTLMTKYYAKKDKESLAIIANNTFGIKDSKGAGRIHNQVIEADKNQNQLWYDNRSFTNCYFYSHNINTLSKDYNNYFGKILHDLNVLPADISITDNSKEIEILDCNTVYINRNKIDLLKNIIASKGDRNELFTISSNLIGTPISRPNGKLSIKDTFSITHKEVVESSLYQEVLNLQKVIKDLDIPVNEEDNWAWVYESPDAFEKSSAFGIDELLLPQNDTQYEDFESLVFDKRRLRPKNPVKQIDKNTWVAKYPIKHPIPKYEDIGIEYIDIEAELMRTIFLEYYRIWQKNIFKFGGMDMRQSVSAILDYLYAWISLGIPLRYQKQAFRVLKLIRWFGESAILQNSQYIIEYEFNDLKSNLYTGDCDIPYKTENMAIDAKDGVFAVSEINKKTFVEFYIRNPKETTITFSVITTVGTVFVYINDELVDKITNTTKNLVYKLKYTDSSNVIRIEKEADHNINKEFFVGYVIAKGCGVSDLHITYDPSLKAGNKPLDEIAQKMIAYADLYENNQEVFENLQKGNLGVSETYKMLKNYWTIHHEQKLKGKRLTIKRT